MEEHPLHQIMHPRSVAIVGASNELVIASSFNGREDDAVAFVQDRNIPCFGSPERAVQAMAALRRYGLIRSRN